MYKKWSRFNFLINNNEYYYLYNSYTNNVLELTEYDYQILQRIEETNIVPQNIEVSFIEELLDEKILVNDDDDDLVYQKIKLARLQARFDTDSLNLCIIPTMSCNFACPYCFEHVKGPKIMDENIENKIVKFIDSHSNLKHLHITWYGGEPLLGFDTFLSLSNKVKQLNLSSFNQSMITNGYLLDKNKIVDLKKNGLSFMQITIDGLEDKHNAMRPHKTYKDSFQKIINNIKLLDSLFPELLLTIRVNLDKSNINTFREVQNYINNITTNPNFICSPAFISEPDEHSTQFRKCISCHEEQADFFLNNYLNNNLIDKLIPELSINECGARKINSIVIGPEGELYKCWNDVGQEKYVYGDIEKGITKSNVYVKYLTSDDQLFDHKCIECAYLPICNGGCPIKRKIRTQDNCTIYKNKIDEFILSYIDKITNS